MGKSSLCNRLLGQERTMVSDIPGTTRDAIDTTFTDADGTRYNIDVYKRQHLCHRRDADRAG